jgi:hypothetical protein
MAEDVFQTAFAVGNASDDAFDVYADRKYEMSESPRKAQDPLSAVQKAHQVLQMSATALGLFLWLAWYCEWPVVDCV